MTSKRMRPGSHMLLAASVRRARQTLLPLLLLSCCGPARESAQTESSAPPSEHSTSAAVEAAATNATSTVQDHQDQLEGETRQALPSAEEIAALPTDGGVEFNRLVFEASPYLRQHARNPVDWFPWGDEAFSEAKRRDVPVFLSIGYATCHWCHVMEHESFEDEEVAALMNANFVCIKVDREERPDLDHVYMQVTQAMTGRGGWPMTVVMTADAEPFFAGTYFPKGGGAGRPGMLELIPNISEAWKTKRETILGDASRITTWLRDNSGGSPGEALDTAVLEAAAREFAQRFDSSNKGFGSAPKFPVPHSLSFLLRWSQRSDDPQALSMVEETLLAMRRGGMYDQVGFGFHRYSTDTRWFLPHFEKMLYDQALHVLAYTGAWQITGSSEYRTTAEEIITYVRRDLGDPGGGFYSAEDADSEGEEGVFYTWPMEDLVAVLGKGEAALFADVYGCKPGGNYSDEASRAPTGRNIPFLARSIAAEATDRDMEAGELKARLEAARVKLFNHREGRIRPFLDDKVLTDWNGLMIAALARAGAAFGEEQHLVAARAAANFVLSNLRDKDGRLSKRWRAGQVGMPATLEDYAFLAFGLLELFKADQDLRWLQEAQTTLDVMLAHFHDPEEGGFFLTADDGADLLVRAKESYDGAIPSGNSVAAYALLQLARLTGDSRYEELAAGTLRAFAGQVRQGPNAHAMMLRGADMLAGGGIEIVIAGDPADPRTQALLDIVRAHHLPNAVLLLHNPATLEQLKAISPYAAAMPPIDGTPAAYLCRNYTCEVPTTDPTTFATNLKAAIRTN
ncbi:MAG: hypothetical protein ACI82F_003293 [Planctomycetota bacterium]|jgi:uncharacterized protein YyaL (SSP411 family)